MSEMIAWLRAQLDTDERLAEQSRTLLLIARTERCAVPGSDEEATFRHFDRHAPDRVLRQVQAHRAILDHYERIHLGRARLTDVALHITWTVLGHVVRALVSIYSDRDGYKEEWSA